MLHVSTFAYSALYLPVAIPASGRRGADRHSNSLHGQNLGRIAPILSPVHSCITVGKHYHTRYLSQGKTT